MKKVKGINGLTLGLKQFQTEILDSIENELIRIGRLVFTTELSFDPFSRKTAAYIKAVWLNEEQRVVLGDPGILTQNKFLSDFLTQAEIGCQQAIDLLALLKTLPGKFGVQPSILTPVSGEQITHEEHDEYAWVCICQNTPDTGGFYSCDEDGDLIEPGDEWEHLYRCDHCGRVLDDRDRRVIGINLNPYDWQGM